MTIILIYIHPTHILGILTLMLISHPHFTLTCMNTLIMIIVTSFVVGTPFYQMVGYWSRVGISQMAKCYLTLQCLATILVYP